MGRSQNRSATTEKDGKSKSKKLDENINSNHSVETAVSRKRAASKALDYKSKSKKSKAVRNSSTERAERSADLSDCELESVEYETAKFDEDQDTVQFEVEKSSDDFVSDGEVDSEYDEVEITPEQIEDNTETEDSEWNENDTSAEEETDKEVHGAQPSTSGHQLKSQIKVVNRDRVEHRLDQLSWTLYAMQDMMKKKEFFDPEGEKYQSKSRKVGNSNRSNREKSEYSISDTTIYHNAVEKAQPENESNHIQ